jgi:hypothetical protein
VPPDHGEFRRGFHDLPRDLRVPDHQRIAIADRSQNTFKILRLWVDQLRFLRQHGFAGLMNAFHQ